MEAAALIPHTSPHHDSQQQVGTPGRPSPRQRRRLRQAYSMIPQRHLRWNTLPTRADSDQQSPWRADRSYPPRDRFDDHPLVTHHFAPAPDLTPVTTAYQDILSSRHGRSWTSVAEEVEAHVHEILCRHVIQRHRVGFYIAGSEADMRQFHRERVMLLVVEMSDRDLHRWYDIHGELLQLLDDFALNDESGVCIRYYRLSAPSPDEVQRHIRLGRDQPPLGDNAPQHDVTSISIGTVRRGIARRTRTPGVLPPRVSASGHSAQVEGSLRRGAFSSAARSESENDAGMSRSSEQSNTSIRDQEAPSTRRDTFAVGNTSNSPSQGATSQGVEQQAGNVNQANQRHDDASVAGTISTHLSLLACYNGPDTSDAADSESGLTVRSAGTSTEPMWFPVPPPARTRTEPANYGEFLALLANRATAATRNRDLDRMERWNAQSREISRDGDPESGANRSAETARWPERIQARRLPNSDPRTWQAGQPVLTYWRPLEQALEEVERERREQERVVASPEHHNVFDYEVESMEVPSRYGIDPGYSEAQQDWNL